jgi:hypothetical protein
LSGCEFFCACAMFLVAAKAETLQPSQHTSDPILDWAYLLLDCANGQNPNEADICPWDGQYTPDEGMNYYSCIPGTVDPLDPSLVPLEAYLPPSGSAPDGQNVVESALFSLPRPARRSRRMPTPRSLRTVDCTDPATALRTPCLNTNREDKPLWP